MDIPAFIDAPIAIKRGDSYYWSDEWRPIMEQLLSTLVINASNEGLIAPTQDANNIALIQNNINYVGTNPTYTAGYGRFVYNSDAKSIQVTVNNGSGIPVFKTVTLT